MHFSNHFIHVNQFALRIALAEKLADVSDDLGRAICVFDGSQRSFSRFFDVGVLPRQPAHARVGVRDRRCNRLIHFMCQ